MRILAAILSSLVLAGICASRARAMDTPLGAPGASNVSVRAGDISFRQAGGAWRQLTQDHDNADPVVSPDGHTVAYVHQDAPSPEEGVPGPTSLWLVDTGTGARRRLLASHPDEAPEHDLTAFRKPVFSLDGGFVYVMASAWATSPAIHQVSVATGRERFVIDGALRGLLRSGPYRGYLLLDRHQYHPGPEFGSYNPVYVVRPDARQLFMVPGSDRDDGEKSLGRWLRRKGWAVW